MLLTNQHVTGPTMSTTEGDQEKKRRHQLPTKEDHGVGKSPACGLSEREQEARACYCSPELPDTKPTTATEEEDQEKRRRHHRHINVQVCPACGLSIRKQELEAHHQSELEQLQRLTTEGSRNSRYPHRKRRRTKIAEEDEESPFSDRRYEEFLRLRRKRETRLRDKAAEGAEEASTSGQSSAAPKCPVCGITLAGTPEEMNRHAEACLIKQTGDGNEESGIINIDDDDDESFEEYTWCGETRVRATTLLEGGLQGCGYKTVRTSKDEVADGDLDVEGDESAEFGPIQYTEENLIHLQDSPASDPPSSDSLQEERHSNINHDRGQQTDSNKNGEIGASAITTNGLAEELRPDQFGCIVNSTEVIKQLKKQLHSMKQELQSKASVRCLVCLDTYKKPVVSVQCWHVYCEDCWMRTLGAKKLCPQCQMITSPSQLRMIYL